MKKTIYLLTLLVIAGCSNLSGNKASSSKYTQTPKNSPCLVESKRDHQVSFESTTLGFNLVKDNKEYEIVFPYLYTGGDHVQYYVPAPLNHLRLKYKGSCRAYMASQVQSLLIDDGTMTIEFIDGQTYKNDLRNFKFDLRSRYKNTAQYGNFVLSDEDGNYFIASDLYQNEEGNTANVIPFTKMKNVLIKRVIRDSGFEPDIDRIKKLLDGKKVSYNAILKAKNGKSPKEAREEYRQELKDLYHGSNKQGTNTNGVAINNSILKTNASIGEQVCRDGMLRYQGNKMFTANNVTRYQSSISNIIQEGQAQAYIDGFSPDRKKVKLIIAGWATKHKMQAKAVGIPYLDNIKVQTSAVIWDDARKWYMCSW